MEKKNTRKSIGCRIEAILERNEWTYFRVTGKMYVVWKRNKKPKLITLEGKLHDNYKSQVKAISKVKDVDKFLEMVHVTYRKLIQFEDLMSS